MCNLSSTPFHDEVASNEPDEDERSGDNPVHEEPDADESDGHSRVGTNDVVCDCHDWRVVFHPGNRNLAILISNVFIRAGALLSGRLFGESEERFRLASGLVQVVKNEQGGRFLARTTRGTLKEISDRLAIRWLSGVLLRVVQSVEECR